MSQRFASTDGRAIIIIKHFSPPLPDPITTHSLSINGIPNPAPPRLPRNLLHPNLAAQIRPLHMRAPAGINVRLPDPHHPQFPTSLPIPPLRDQPLQPLAFEINFPPETDLDGFGARHDLVDLGLDRGLEVPAYEPRELARGAAGEVRGFELVEVRDGRADGGADCAAEDVAGGVQAGVKGAFGGVDFEGYWGGGGWEVGGGSAWVEVKRTRWRMRFAFSVEWRASLISSVGFSSEVSLPAAGVSGRMVMLPSSEGWPPPWG